MFPIIFRFWAVIMLNEAEALPHLRCLSICTANRIYLHVINSINTFITPIDIYIYDDWCSSNK